MDSAVRYCKANTSVPRELVTRIIRDKELCCGSYGVVRPGIFSVVCHVISPLGRDLYIKLIMGNMMGFCIIEIRKRNKSETRRISILSLGSEGGSVTCLNIHATRSIRGDSQYLHVSRILTRTSAPYCTVPVP